MCKYCDKKPNEIDFEALYDNDFGTYILIDRDMEQLVFSYNDVDDFEIDINYCPMCGKAFDNKWI